MKKLILLSLFGTGIFTSAQVVVSDPVMQASIGEEIQHSLTQIEQFEKNLTLLEKAQERVDVVSSHVRDISELKNILLMQKESIVNATKVKNRLSEFGSFSYKKNVLVNVESSLTLISTSIGMLNKVLTTGFFKMTDKERMDYIKEQKTQVYRAYVIINKYTL